MKKITFVAALLTITTITVMSFTSNIESKSRFASQLYEYKLTTNIFPADGFSATERALFIDDQSYNEVSQQPQACQSSPKLCSVLIDAEPASTAILEAVLDEIVDEINANGYPGDDTEFTVTVSSVDYKIKMYRKA